MPQAAAVWVAAADRLRKRLRVAAVAAAIERHDSGPVLGGIDWPAVRADLLRRYLPTLQKVAEEAGTATRQDFADASIGFTFNIHDPAFDAEVRKHGAALVREVTDETGRGIRDLVEQAYRDGLHPYRAARLIEKDIGLTSRQGQAVLRRYQSLLEDHPEERAGRMSERYARRLLRYRAKTIARTETMRAANIGRYQGFRQAADKGLFDTSRAWVEWLTSEDERVCEICAPLDRQRVRMGDYFQTLVGPLRHPLAHVDCRCMTLLVI